ncbi:hypothetical protein JR065_02725 [Xanthomonas sp. AmX2]|uniref:hypothetical protein n=1 Tax=Xanthomonas sp. TaxID=29446 RepID=UPI00197CE112|nr:hypothetical protein [Xanthomonas sp.]MBN6149244.1 hypothetical protein [Xanthomonas sp.]
MDKLITVEQAYMAMFEYWLEVYKRTNSDEIGTVLSELSILEDGSSADPAAINDWLQVIDRVVKGEHDIKFKILPDEH